MSQALRVETKADLKEDGKPLLYRLAPPPVDFAAGAAPSASPTDIPTHGVITSVDAKWERAESIRGGDMQVWLPALDFSRRPLPGDRVFEGPSGSLVTPSPSDTGVTNYRVVTLLDTVIEGSDDIMYLALVRT